MKSNIGIPTFILYLLMLFTHSAALAEERNQANIMGGWVLGGLFTEGGDTLGEVEITTIFDNTDTEKLKGGRFIYFYGGYNWIINPKKQNRNSVQVTVGYHSDFITGGDDSVSFDRFPVDWIGYQHKGPWRAGAGITYHFSPTLDLNDVGYGSYDFDEALGFLLELGYELSPNKFVTVRLTEIDYEINNTELSGSNIGIGFSGIF